MKRLIVIFATIFAISACSNEPTELDAQLNAEQYVKQLLKSPSTAVFGTADITEVEQGVFSVQSYVDSQNDFGGVVRTNYECTVRYEGNSKVKIENFKSY